MQNSDFWTRITSLYGSQTWLVVLGMYISVLSSRNTSLYWPQTSSVVFACKTAWLEPELIVSVGPSPHVWFLNTKQRLLTKITNLYWSQTSPVVLGMQYSVIRARITCLYGSQSLSVVFACKTGWFAPEWQVYMDSSPHLWFCALKTATLRPNCTCLWVLDLTCDLLHAKQRA